jgi:DNA-binding transcriptional LysR family regulator
VELRHLKSFQTVARTLNITHAAAELNYAQSSITDQIKALEAELGTELFDRTGRRLALTAAGERLLAYADRILMLADEAHDLLVGPGTGEADSLVVAGLETLCAHHLPLVLPIYRRNRPQTYLQVLQGGRAQLHTWAQEGEAEVALVFGPPMPRPQLASETLATEDLVVVLPPGHALAGRPFITGTDLAGAAFLATPPGCGFRAMLDRLRAALGPDAPRIVAEVGSMTALRRCAASGMGCALLPVSAVADDVTAVPLTGEASSTEITMLYNPVIARRPPVHAFLQTVRAAFGELHLGGTVKTAS